ncbi:uncharacterized protein V1510DRAFT_361350 [Dipodascopsis tothii]|uniref:uncharacterized protein n=1 Tax=Dipodascopsis tothii TaxID=44089 RepID=UPI0034CE9309
MPAVATSPVGSVHTAKAAVGTAGAAPPAPLTGAQEHYLKKELISLQVGREIEGLGTADALREFGEPFLPAVSTKSESPATSSSTFPILRHVFVQHVRTFPFLDQTDETEFWQGRVQKFWESFMAKQISSTEDRSEETKRKRLAFRAQRMIEIMFSNAIKTTSGIEAGVDVVVDDDAIEARGQQRFVLENAADGHAVNGLDINVVGVREVYKKKRVKSGTHLEYIVRVSRPGHDDCYVAKRYSDFTALHQALLHEHADKGLPNVPMKNKRTTTIANSMSSASSGSSRRTIKSKLHVRARPALSQLSSPAPAGEALQLPGELQRLSLRAFLRSLLEIPAVAESPVLVAFLTEGGFGAAGLTGEEKDDMDVRHKLDTIRFNEQMRFFQIAKRRARELDEYMASFKKDIVQRDGLTRFFGELREKDSIRELAPKYQKFVEWARIELAAMIYRMFVGQDNASELLAQTKRIHRLLPYTLLKNVMRFSNPVSMMKGVLDIFLAQPLGQRSLLQRILSVSLSEDLRTQDKAIAAVRKNVGDDAVCDRLQAFVSASADVHDQIVWEADQDGTDLIVAIVKTEELGAPVPVETIGRIINAWVSWNVAVDDVDVAIDSEMRLFSNLKTLLKLMIRRRDKDLILSLSGERVTIELLKDVFTLFYQPLVRVYKSANVYNSVTDLAAFVDDLIKTVEECDEEGTTLDANVLVQRFVDLCERHQEAFYRFVHEVHVNDNGLFTNLMVWIEGILQFLREGPGRAIDMNALYAGAAGPALAAEVDAVVEWNRARKLWKERRTREKLAAGGAGSTLPKLGLSGGDFGLMDEDLEDSAEAGDDDDEFSLDPIEYERRMRTRKSNREGRNGEPPRPDLVEIPKLLAPFMEQLQAALAAGQAAAM